ncbi:guanosine monophosphate reductase [Psittacicella melopsittaci]|uniref:Guanosine monophosphate reductase n=1 Tax=Psittacicella melopsittaci TaxID=2028576 RepID=A0A3A1Y1T4_9GAMM|nr:IMP dehydrogenase [Psittacicella melopsittaci]RIY31411.1 guanosine monophosphate reductase [Psittacicella melopsittaci]
MLRIKYEGVTFDDVLIIPRASTVLPNTANLQTKLTKNIDLNVPIISSAMDTVTEYELATSLALIGGVGFIHKNMSPVEQARQVGLVKNYYVDLGKYPNAAVDKENKLRVGAAVGAGDGNEERIRLLVEAGVDVILIDSSHGHSAGVVNRVKQTRKDYPDLDIIAGNIATAEAAIDLVEAGASAVKVGIGPGSICTTRIVTGCGVPQLSAIDNAVTAIKHTGIPVIADGGIRYSGDIVKALVAGASCVMLGSILGATEEAPGEKYEMNGKRYKSYRGMGSLAAMSKGSSDRYFQSDNAKDKLVPEGVEGRVEIKGSVAYIVHQLVGGIRSAMGLSGCPTIEALNNEAEFVKVSGATLSESHVHGIMLEKVPDNYSK